jgi:prepilin-type N-terminal cleavage/methylation domain-containing protein
MEKVNFKKGFTLIELLVVVAIIGILASVVLASLNTARAKGANAAIKSSLSNIRAQAEMVYDSSTDGVYTEICSDQTIIMQLNGAAKALGGTVAVENSGAIASNTVVCNDSTGAWAAGSPLKTAGYFCVDSVGRAIEVTTSPITANNDYSCQ